MLEKPHKTENGDIHYWISENLHYDAATLVFLPGLTADHRLFVKQCDYFELLYNVFVWDCPCHGKSRPYDVFTYSDVSSKLHTILEKGLPQSHWLRTGFRRWVKVAKSGGLCYTCVMRTYFLDRWVFCLQRRKCFRRNAAKIHRKSRLIEKAGGGEC